MKGSSLPKDEPPRAGNAFWKGRYSLSRGGKHWAAFMPALGSAGTGSAGPSPRLPDSRGRRGARRPCPLTRAVNTRITFFKSNFL